MSNVTPCITVMLGMCHSIRLLAPADSDTHPGRAIHRPILPIWPRHVGTVDCPGRETARWRRGFCFATHWEQSAQPAPSYRSARGLAHRQNCAHQRNSAAAVKVPFVRLPVRFQGGLA